MEFEFDRQLERMVSYRAIQSGLPRFLVGEFGTSEILCKNDRLLKPDFSYFSDYKHIK